MELLNENPTKLDLFATSDLIAELSRRGYKVNAIYEKDSMSKDIITAMNRISWDNWENEDGTHYKLGGVYFCKLDWIKEYMLGEKYTTYEEGYDEELDEKLDIINDLQETICPILNLIDNE